jgi:RNA processing factor Prp31
MNTEENYVAFLNETEEEQKRVLVDKLEKNRKDLIETVMQMNNLIVQLKDHVQEVNDQIHKINCWIRSIHADKSEELNTLPGSEQDFTKLTDLHCYASKFEKIRIRVPECFDLNSIGGDIDSIIAEFEGMP